MKVVRRRRRFLMAEGIMKSRGEALAEFAAEQESALAACPEAARFEEQEVETFWAAALYLDMLEPDRVAKQIQRARISYPPELAFDDYRLGRHLFRRWNDPAVREAFLERALELEMGPLARMGRERDLEGIRPTLNHWGGPAFLCLLRRFRLDDLAVSVLESYTPEEAARHQALMQYGRLQLHRFLTEPEPARAPSPWERQKLARRIRLREVQMRAMRRSLRKVGQERKALQARLRELARTEHPELRPLADEWASLRKKLQEMERQHRAELAAMTARYQEAQARLRSELAAAQESYRRTLTLRRSWLRVERG